MKYRVLLNTDNNYLAITTSDVSGKELNEIFSSEWNADEPLGMHISLGMCKIFCLGYLQGNDGIKAKNSAEDFK